MLYYHTFVNTLANQKKFFTSDDVTTTRAQLAVLLREICDIDSSDPTAALLACFKNYKEAVKREVIPL